MILTGILFLGYGISLRLLESSQWYRILWFLAGGGLLLCGAVPSIPAWITVLSVLLAVFILLLIAVMSMLNLLTIRNGIGKTADVILVLGCKIGSRGFHFRAQAAANYLKQAPGAKVICCGGQGSDEPCTEAEQFAREIEAAGIAADRIMQEGKSSTTAENIRNSIPLIKDLSQPVGIVSSDYHLFRSTAVAKKLQIRQAFGIPSGTILFYVPDYMLREALACIKGVLVKEL